MRLHDSVGKFKKALKEAVETYQFKPVLKEQGVVESVEEGIAVISGLPNAMFYEVVKFSNNLKGIIIDVKEDKTTAVILEKEENVELNTPVYRTGYIVSVPVSEKLLGRLIDPLGKPLDGKPPVETTTYYPVERDAPALFDRDFVKDQLYTGIKVIDSMFPIGKGQRELILGDPSTGKTSIAVDTIINQKDKNVICIYVSIGQRKQSVLDVYSVLKKYDALDYTIIVSATSDQYPGLQFLAPYSATAIGEYFLDKGKDVLIVYDDLTKHAFAYQSLSLLLKRPPGREAFPGDIFYIHSRLLERACKIKDGGSITALPIVETQAGRISSYIPTNVISITDGQIYLDTNLFNINQRPAVDVGKSVSRIGGKTQIPALKEVAEFLRLYYAQFLEVEIFTKLGVKVFGETAQIIRRGKRLRELLKQPKLKHYQVQQQVVLFFLLNEGYFDNIPVDNVNDRADFILKKIEEEHPEILDDIKKSKVLTKQTKEKIKKLVENI
ncbi:MAG TPA: F0F1 ATP synthase subunit alpha [Persephonella sp.]|nr:F0F1 ATP synthase subunit alpha [Persephonella sp.]